MLNIYWPLGQIHKPEFSFHASLNLFHLWQRLSLNTWAAQNNSNDSCSIFFKLFFSSANNFILTVQNLVQDLNGHRCSFSHSGLFLFFYNILERLGSVRRFLKLTHRRSIIATLIVLLVGASQMLGKS